jgi:hypothetical protein
MTSIFAKAFTLNLIFKNRGVVLSYTPSQIIFGHKQPWTLNVEKYSYTTKSTTQSEFSNTPLLHIERLPKTRKSLFAIPS